MTNQLFTGPGMGQAPSSGLSYLAVEVSWGTRWVNINDHEMYRIAGDQTMETTAKSWRKVTAQSPVLGGTYLVHAVPEMVSEQVGVWVYGSTQPELSDNLFNLQELFQQYDYNMRWTFDDYRETWHCQLADTTVSRGQVWTHSIMARCQFTIPRWPDLTREHY